MSFMQAPANILSTKSFINNEWIGSNSSAELLVTNKYEQLPIAKIPFATVEEIEISIATSVKAFLHFKKTTIPERREILKRMRENLAIEKDRFVNLIINEAGKPHSYAEAEVLRALNILDIVQTEMMNDVGEMVPMNYAPGIGKTAYTKKFPVGPILAISPFNFPLNLALHKSIPAIATGNTVILKPSPFTPLTALAFASLCKKSGLPEGVLNVVVCQNNEAEILVKDPRIKMVSFTGSADIGWHIKSLAAKKKVTLELGGNAAAIVDRTSNLEEVAKNLSLASFLYSGQICISTQRIYIDESVFDEFKNYFIEETKKLKIGSPLDKEVVVGPLIDKKHLERIHFWVRDAIEKGAILLHGGAVIDEQKNLYAPTILTNTKIGMKVVDEEVFGPVVILEKVKYFDEVIELINQSRYGLQASLFTNQLSQIKYAEENLEVGALIVNAIPGFRIDSMPYGGVKDSGFGREGIKYAMNEMQEMRLVVL